ncbi:MAG TPA: helix-turn-helix transcriptional regulator [Pyrinomonadaceae bacterium]|nr:helix-turn-helix transcriptional regulator [Pyrinomonadaceae bacterium]
MSILSHQDAEKLLSAIAVLHSDINPETLPQRTFAAINQLIFSDYISFDGFRRTTTISQAELELDPNFEMPETGLLHFSESWYDYEFNPTSDELEIIDKYSHENPIFNEVILKNKLSPAKITDFISANEFHQSTIYNEYFRRGNSRFAMALMLPVASEVEISCALGRTYQDFSEDDRTRLTLLAPHLASAINNSRSFKELQLNKTHLETALEAEKNAIIVLSRHGRTILATNYANKLLEKYYADEKPLIDCLPESLRRVVDQLNNLGQTGDFSMQPVFIIKGKDGELHIKIVTDSINGEQLILLDEKPSLTPSDLEPLGLTKREAEVLYWAGLGKGDFEIAALCGISIRTVQKHNEQIFRKMGVENRTAAVLKMMEVLGLMKKIFLILLITITTTIYQINSI